MGWLSKILGPGTDYKALKERNALIIDVRTKPEFDAGHIAGAKHIPLDDLDRHIASLKKDRPVITCCRSGMRSGVAAKKLKAAGFEVYNGGPWQSLASRL